jgi:hypothetical protein
VKDGLKDEHLILLGEINGKVDLLVARGLKDGDCISALEAWWGRRRLLISAPSPPKLRDAVSMLGLI